MILMKKFEVDLYCIRLLNSYSLFLIPKKKCASDIKDLRPISLLNYSYKIAKGPYEQVE